MRALANTLTTLQSVWSNGQSMRMAAFHRLTCGCAFSMQVPGVLSKPWQIHRKECNV